MLGHDSMCEISPDEIGQFEVVAKTKEHKGIRGRRFFQTTFNRGDSGVKSDNIWSQRTSLSVRLDRQKFVYLTFARTPLTALETSWKTDAFRYMTVALIQRSYATIEMSAASDVKCSWSVKSSLSGWSCVCVCGRGRSVMCLSTLTAAQFGSV